MRFLGLKDWNDSTCMYNGCIFQVYLFILKDNVAFWRVYSVFCSRLQMAGLLFFCVANITLFLALQPSKIKLSPPAISAAADSSPRIPEMLLPLLLPPRRSPLPDGVPHTTPCALQIF